ncbi:Ig-like domain-containing protein [Gallaecimonas mangrovi]|uniref:Ig-like domain-containing protein n=1 Tax=Gallaecimonas mangrovi TaxID=2291597 RepID=UPI000E1FF2A6|nr:Ig-like domain-containing protein [Gallaecimonas mangrovi]
MWRLLLLLLTLMAVVGQVQAKELVLVDAALAPDVHVEKGQQLRIVQSLDELPSALAGSQWSRVSLVSHGASGVLEIAGQRLDQAYLAAHPEFFARWQQHLTADAQVELWGCDVASGTGYQLVDAISASIARPVLASTDATGPAALGGDLILEYGQGRAANNVLLAQLPILLAVSNEDFESVASSPTYFSNNSNIGNSFVFYSNLSSGHDPFYLNSLTSINGNGPDGSYWLYFYSVNIGDVTEIHISSQDGSEFKLDSFFLDTNAGDSTVTLHGYRDGVEIGSTTASTGTVTLSSNTTFNNIDALYITGSDLDVLVDDITVSAAVSGDTEAPAAPSTPVLDSSSDSGTSGDSITNDTTPTLTGTGEANASLVVRDGSTQVGSTTVDSSGNWSVTTSTLAEGSHSFTAVQTDGAGNESDASAALSLTIDTTAPSGYSLVVDQSEINSSNQSESSVTFSSAEVGASYQFAVSSSGGGTAVSGSGTVASSDQQLTGLDVSGLNDGTLSYSLTLTDVAGNAGSASVASVTKDTQQPAATSSLVLDSSSDSGTSGDDITNDTTPTLSGTGEANASLVVRDGSTQVGSTTVDSSGNWSVTTSTLAEGSHSLTAVQTDGAGNESDASAALSLTIDTTAPSGYSLVVDQSEINSSNQSASSVTFSSAEVGASYQFAVSSSGGGTAVSGSGTVTASNQQLTGIDVSGLNDGTLSYSLTLTDVAGNAGSASVASVTKDTETSTGANSAPTISGSPDSTAAAAATYSFIPSASDADGDSLTFSIVNKPSWASFDTSTGALTGSPTQDDVGTYSNIQISVTDGTETASLTVFSIEVTDGNTAPVANADSYSLAEGGLLTTTAANGVLANDSDTDNDTLTATLLSGPAQASSFSLNSDGSFSYQHDGSESTSDSFMYTVSDGNGGSSSATVTLTISPVNDAPEFTSTAPSSMVVGSTLSYQVEVNDPDSAVTLTLTEAPSWLTLDDDVLTGTAPAGSEGDHTVTLTASDGAKTATQSFVLEVSEATQSVVALSRSWQGLPARVGKDLALVITAQHQAGPALDDATLEIQWQGGDMTALAGCTLTGDVQSCPLTLAIDADVQFTLPVSTDSQGDQTVSAKVLSSDGSVLGELTTDVTVAANTVSQGDISTVISQATSLALLTSDSESLLAVGTSSDDNITLYRFDGDSLVAEAIIDNTGNTKALAAIDWNQDGLDDLVVINSSGQASGIYINQGDLTFSLLQTLPYGRKVQVAELNDDDYPDLLINGLGLYLFSGNLGGSSAALQIVQTPFTVSNFAVWPDGRLLVTNGTELSLIDLDVVADQSAAGSAFSALADDTASGSINSLQVSDLVGDGTTRAIIGYSLDADGNGGGITVMKADGSTLNSVVSVGDAAVSSILTGDFDDDGDIDILVQHDNGTWQLLSNDGSADSFTASTQTLFHPDSLGLVADLDGDGLLDILLADTLDDAVAIYNGNASFELGPQADLELASHLTDPQSLTSFRLPATAEQYQTRYKLVVTNNGSADDNDVTLTLSIPDAIGVDSWPDGCVESAVGWQCDLGALANGASTTFELLLQGDVSLADAVIDARVDGSAGDTDQSNNSVENSLGEPWPSTVHKHGGGALSWPWLLLLVLIGRRRRLH